MALALSLIAALLFGVADFSCGLATRKAATIPVILLSQAAGALLALVVAPLLATRPPELSDLGWGFLAGLCGAGGLAALYRGIAKGVVAIVAPLSALVAALMPVAFGALLGERPSLFAIFGGALCLPAIALLAWEKGDQHSRQAARESLFLGLCAGFFLGGFYIAISRTSPDSGLWPLVAARGSSMLAVSIVAIVIGARPFPVRGARIFAALGGFFDMAANACFLLASRTGLLMIVSIVTSLYPAPTVILARIFFRQRLGFTRIAGLVLALSGVTLIAIP